MATEDRVANSHLCDQPTRVRLRPGDANVLPATDDSGHESRLQGYLHENYIGCVL